MFTLATDVVEGGGIYVPLNSFEEVGLDSDDEWNSDSVETKFTVRFYDVELEKQRYREAEKAREEARVEMDRIEKEKKDKFEARMLELSTEEWILRNPGKDHSNDIAQSEIKKIFNGHYIAMDLSRLLKEEGLDEARAKCIAEEEEVLKRLRNPSKPMDSELFKIYAEGIKKIWDLPMAERAEALKKFKTEWEEAQKRNKDEKLKALEETKRAEEETKRNEEEQKRQKEADLEKQKEIKRKEEERERYGDAIKEPGSI
jgi:hypothetical protein